MKKIIALMLALMLTLSVVTLPATAETTAVASVNPEVTTLIKKVDIDALDSSIDYFTGASSTSASGFSFSHSSGNYSVFTNYTGVVDTTNNKIYKYPLYAKKDTETIQDGYAKGENFKLIIGEKLGETYPGTGANTTGKIVEGQPMKGAYLKKVSDPEDPTNSVIEFNYGQTGNGSPTGVYTGLITRLTFGTNTKMLEPATDTAPASKINSGILAYEWDIYVPENSAKYMTTGSRSINLGGIHADNTSGADILDDQTKYTSNKLMHYLSTHETFDADNKPVSKTAASFEIKPDMWHNVKQVMIIDDVALDPTNELNYTFPLIAYYFDGELIGTIRSRNKLLNSTSSGQVRFALAPTPSSKYADQSINYNIYLDNVSQYWIDTLSVSGIKDVYTNFAPSSDSVVINYTNPVDSEALKEAITVKLDGVETEDVTVNVETPDKYTAKVSFKGLNVKKATTYSVEIAEFKDQYLSTAEGKSFTVTTAPEFVATANPEVFEGFKAGTERTVDFAFSATLGTAPENAFIVKDANGKTMTGWTAELSSKNKVATISLKNLDATGTFPYTLTVAPDAKNEAGKTIVEATVVKINKVGKYDIFTETFSEDKFDTTNWTIFNAGTGNDIASATIEKDPANTESTNGVLKFEGQAVDSSAFKFYLRRNVPSEYGSAIDFTSPSSPFYGKKLVLEVDNYKPAADKNNHINDVGGYGAFLAFSRSKNNISSDSSAYTGNYSRWYITGTSFSVQNTSNSATKVAKNIYQNRLNASASTNVSSDKWETFRMIFDQTDITRHDTHRTYKIGDNGSLTVTKGPYTYVKNPETLTTTTTKTANEGANKYPEYVYDFMAERMTNEKYLLFPGEENFSYNTSNEYGTFYGAMFGWDFKTSKGIRYIDNLKAYAVDPFKMVQFSENVNEFIPEKSSTIEIGFNQTLYSDVDKLKNNIMLLTKDENGEDVNVTDLISDITFNNSKDAVAITLNSAGLVDNKEYEIAFGPEFIDEYGQALAVYQSEVLVDRTRIYGDYAVNFEVLPYEGFNASVDNAMISNFYTGANKKVVVTLTQPTVLDANAISSAFEVKDANGEVVTGWNAILSADSKSIIINFAGMSDAKAFPYTLTSLDALVNAEDESIPAPIKVTISDLEGIYPIFEETFDNFKENVEWKDNLDSNNWVTSANTGVGENTWKYVNSATSDLNSVMVVNETVGDRTGKFLKYTSGNSGTNNTPHILRNSNGDIGIKFTDTNSNFYGKKLVYQVDVYFDGFAPINNNYSSLLNFNNDPNSKSEGTFARFDANGVTVNAGVWEQYDYLRRTTLNLKGGWHTVTAVVDQTGTNPEINYDNVRYYLDGNPVIVPYYKPDIAQKEPTYYLSNERQQASNPAPSFGTFFGTAFGAQSNGKCFYLDNLKAYAIDGVAFGIEEIDFNKATGVITAKFNSIIDNKFMSLVTIEDADGNVVSGGTKSILADGKTIEISGIIEPEFELLTAYKLKIDGLFRDIYLNEFNCYNDYEFEFVTARSGEISVANEPVAVISDNKLTTTVEVVNKTDKDTNFVMAVAAYNGYKLLGVQTIPVTLGAMSNISENFELTGDFSNVTNVKIHFWDSISEMNALSIPEPVKLGE